jgi:DNA repair and recombination protein RAD54B
LFNVYPYVSCHTHELLGCPCGSNGLLTAEEEVPSKPGRKFVQEDSDDEEVEMGFIRGTQVNPDKLTKKVCVCQTFTKEWRLNFGQEMRQRREALSSLSEWRHIDCTMSSAKGLLQDNVLRALVVNPNGTAIGNRTSPEDPDGLWDGFGYDDSTEDGTLTKSNVISVGDLPGGSVTFAFERVSKTDL